MCSKWRQVVKQFLISLEKDKERVIDMSDSEGSDFQEYVESVSKGECWSSSDEEHAEFFE